MKRRKRHMTERKEVPNQDKIKMLGEMVTLIYLGILEADTTKQAEMKGKIKKNTPREQENYSKPNYIAEISSKG